MKKKRVLILCILFLGCGRSGDLTEYPSYSISAKGGTAGKIILIIQDQPELINKFGYFFDGYFIYRSIDSQNNPYVHVGIDTQPIFNASGQFTSNYAEYLPSKPVAVDTTPFVFTDFCLSGRLYYYYVIKMYEKSGKISQYSDALSSLAKAYCP